MVNYLLPLMGFTAVIAACALRIAVANELYNHINKTK